MKALNENQRNAIERIQLSAEKISEVEKATGWQYAQHTNGSDIRFNIFSSDRNWKYKYDLVVWLHSKAGSEITIGVWANNDKSLIQDEFRNIFGDWAPTGMTVDPNKYGDRGQNLNIGHVGDWHTGIKNVDFGNNVKEIQRMVDTIKKKMNDTGIDVFLQNGVIPNDLKATLPDGKKINDQLVVRIGGQKDNKVEEVKNLIVFGAPGTGKSHKLEEDRKVFGERYERVTFYPTYSYAQFVGTYKPVMKPIVDDNGQPIINAQGNPKEEIAYEFVPGPFLRVLVNALNEEPDADKKKKEWCLVIEEINRANAAAVFGDVFQLLDRKNGVSEYPVAVSEDVKKYLLKEVKTEAGKTFLEIARRKDSQGNETEEWDCSLRIPDNMYIWATMNSADQGVFPMDTAFKRRWEFDYIGIDDEAEGDCLNWSVEGKGYAWNDVRRYVNGLLAEHDVNEDKLMGPYFIKAIGDVSVISRKSFASKVLMYLWEDAGRMIRRNLFGNQIKTYSQLVRAWETDGVKVFSQCAKKENLSQPLKDLYTRWTTPSAEQNA